MKKTKISPYGKVKLYWNDKPENYSRANRLAVRNTFAKKYGVDKDRVKVVYRPVKIDNKGNVIKLEGVQIENVGDVLYQRKLFKEWIERNEKVVNFEHLVRLDDKVNAELDTDRVQSVHRKWDFDWLMIDNLLSFGDNNFFPVDNFKGLVVVASNPENMGGKTTLIIDTFKFLLFGVTTKTNKNEQIFNRFRDKNTLTVRGLMRIEGENEFIIERKLSRKLSRSGTWTVTSTLNYYWLLPDDTEESMKDEDTAQTTKKIRETVGDVKDFDLVSLATGDNLASLISNTVTENSKIFTRMIGLEVLELKEAIVRKMYIDYSKTMQSNTHSKVEMEDEIEQSEVSLELVNNTLELADAKLVELTTKIDEQEVEKTKLLGSKHVVDSKLDTININTLITQIDTVTKDGIKIKATLDEQETSYSGIEVDFDEYREKRVTDRINELTTSKALKHAESTRMMRDIENLKNAEICSACDRPLADIDNTAKIDELVKTCEAILKEGIAIEKELEELKAEKESFAAVKLELERKQRLELEIERTKLKLAGMRTNLGEFRDTKKAYEVNIKAIQHNQDVDSKVTLITSTLQVDRFAKEETIKKVGVIKGEILTHESKIALNKSIVAKIIKEGEIERIFKMYIEMVGKKGVSKIILRSVIPIINSELDRLLEGVCDFEIEVRIDDKNDINLIIIQNGVEGLLKSASGFERTVSAVALRTVLGIVSTLPMPNFIAFDEVLDKVANVNLPLMKPLFDKVADSYDKVFLITHKEEAKDWSNKTITVSKDVKNISSIDYK